MSFSKRVILAVDQAALLTVRELINFLNTNNRRRARVNEVDLTSINASVGNYFFKHFSFTTVHDKDKESFIQKLEGLLSRFDNDTRQMEKLKKIIKDTIDPLTLDYENEEQNFVPAIYDDLTFFSLDTKSIIDIVEFHYFDGDESRLVEADDVQLTVEDFNPGLYNQIISDPQLLHSTTWREFEYVLSKILESFEYEVELQKGTKDGGIDIIAIKKNDPLGVHKYLIQAKKWKKKVGIEPVQQLAFLKDYYKASKACLATTSTFTKGAWQLAKMYPWQLELKDFNGLLDWINLVKLNSHK